jgi:hypothetical protein
MISGGMAIWLERRQNEPKDHQVENERLWMNRHAKVSNKDDNNVEVQ